MSSKFLEDTRHQQKLKVLGLLNYKETILKYNLSVSSETGNMLLTDNRDFFVVNIYVYGTRTNI